VIRLRYRATLSPLAHVALKVDSSSVKAGSVISFLEDLIEASLAQVGMSGTTMPWEQGAVSPKVCTM
jgi:hypothetical protein